MKKDHVILALRPNVVIINKEKKTCQVMDVDVPTDNRVRLKENEKKSEKIDVV